MRKVLNLVPSSASTNSDYPRVHAHLYNKLNNWCSTQYKYITPLPSIPNVTMITNEAKKKASLWSQDNSWWTHNISDIAIGKQWLGQGEKNNQCLHSFHLPTYTIQNLNCSLECNAVIQQDLVTYNLATASNAVNVFNSSWVLNMPANIFK